jgi:hypothetical protein
MQVNEYRFKPQMQSRLNEVSEADPHSSFTQKHYQPSRPTNFTNITISAMKQNSGEHKDLFYQSLDSLLATKVATKAQ